MKLTRRQLNNVIVENLFGKRKKKKQTEKELEADIEAMKSKKVEEPKYVVMMPSIPDDLPNDNMFYLQKNISREAGKTLGRDKEIDVEDFTTEIEKFGMDDSDLEVRSQLEMSQKFPMFKIIHSSLQYTPDKKQMYIELDMYLDGKRVSSSDGKLSGVKEGYHDDGTHESDAQLAKYVKELVT